VNRTSSTRKMSVWEKSLLGVTADKVPSLLPGLLVAALLAWFSIWLSKYVGVTLLHFDKTSISAVMLAILLGLIIGPSLAIPVALTLICDASPIHDTDLAEKHRSAS
jgi:hypothetical protein